MGWANLRQEPVVYVNGKPFTAREPAKINYHLEVKNPDDVSKMEDELAEVVQGRGEDFKFYQDQYGEHPDERAVKNDELTEKLANVSTLTAIYGGLKEKNEKVNAIRIPLNQETAPAEECFDQITALLKNTSASTPIVFNCQAGISRTTTAMVIASLVKEFQLASELNHMKGIVPDDILEALKKKKLGLPGIDIEAAAEKNAMMAGEFEVIIELMEAYKEGNQAKIAKAQVDKLIDLAAPPPKGTGVQNIRECIIESKMTFDVSADDWQAYLKEKIMSNIERYFYLIMIAEGRGKLEWERKIPDEKLVDLKDLLNTPDFKNNLPKVIKRIYELAWEQFSDLPRGHHKNNSMHKLASKTMIEILPEKLMKHIEAKCGSVASTPDFFDVIGQVSWYEEEKKD